MVCGEKVEDAVFATSHQSCANHVNTNLIM